jgi:hypothetical protein
MTKSNYIIFHPDYARQKVTVHATSVVGKRLTTNWKGNIWVDQVGIGNEDPYVFHNGWIYSYCHASQLRRQVSKNYIQPGSWLIFCSGDFANDGVLCVDTVFEVGDVHLWGQKPLSLPTHFNGIKNMASDLWNRHFKFPFKGYHSSVTHTYEAALGKGHSFIPLFQGERVRIDFDELKADVRRLITRKVKGKIPVILSDAEIAPIVKLIRQCSDIQVLMDIQILNPINSIKHGTKHHHKHQVNC